MIYDIVVRLKDEAEDATKYGYMGYGEIMLLAAKEIESLRKELNAARESLVEKTISKQEQLVEKTVNKLYDR